MRKAIYAMMQNSSHKKGQVTGSTPVFGVVTYNELFVLSSLVDNRNILSPRAPLETV